MANRLDQEMVRRQLVLTRSQARMLIKQGDVHVDGSLVSKPGYSVEETSEIKITSDQLYVSRGAYKLKKAIEEFDLEFENLIVVDCGASTGGFTEVLLEQGVQKVYALDVGHDQLADKLRTHPKVENREGVNLKDPLELPEKVDACVADLSFISLKKVLPTMKTFLKPGGFLVLLIKPQFEAGKERVGKAGIVDSKYHQSLIDNLIDYFSKNGLINKGLCESPITGKKGNTEYLIYLT